MKLLKLAATCLTAISLLGCDSAPDLHPKLIDYRRNRYLEYTLTDKENFTFTKVGFRSGLEDLDGHYAISAEEIGRWNAWGRRQADRLKKCEASR